MRARGFTLIEVMVATLVAVGVISLIMSTFLTQQRSLQGLDIGRISQEHGRDALLELEGTLRRAGWGVDPTYAFDFSYRCPATPCRDSATGPDSLAFVSRDPAYGWNGTTFTGRAWNVTSVDVTGLKVNFTGHGGEVFYPGQVVLLMCTDVSKWTMGTVTDKVTVPSGGGASTVTLSTTVPGNPYTTNDLSPGCMSTAGMFKVNRYHYSIVSYASGNETCRTPPCTQPWLVLDDGLDRSGSGIGDASNYIPIARGVEDLQVAYAYNADSTGTYAAPDTTSTKNWVLGDYLSAACDMVAKTSGTGTVEEPSPTATAPAWPPTQGTLATAVNYNASPANIRAVRLTLTLRSDTPDPSRPSTFVGDPRGDNENHPCLPSGAALGGYRRLTLRSTVTLRNLGTSSPFVF